MTQVEQALHFLESDPLLHIDMLECIRRGNAEWIYAGDHGALLCDRPSGTYMISADTEAVARECLEKLDRIELLVCHQELYKDMVSSVYGLTMSERCYQAAYLGKKALPEPDADWKIRPLDESYLAFVREHYQMVPEEGYIHDRLTSGMMYGIFVDDVPAGFVGMHAEGSLGMLEILPEYRRKGLAYALEAYAINRMLERGWTPYGQVIDGNLASMGLQKKLGLSISDKTCYWVS